jgi:membrane-bound lytic murein transglycosylase B
VSVFTVVRRARVLALASLAAGLLAAGPVVMTPAHADTTGNASAKVQALLKKVHSLQAQAKAAESRYQRAFNQVADSVNVAITADQDSANSANRADAAQAALVDRVRALYESGGELAADASVLNSGNLTELYDRNELATRAVSSQVASVHAANTAAQTAQLAASQAEKREHLKIGTERTVAVAATSVQRLLAEQAALLKKADKHLAAVRKAAVALAAQTQTFSAITTTAIAGLHILPPSALYLSLYKAAAPTCPGLPWTVLAAIGQVESGHGRNTSTSSAGAMGPMQFEPATFAAYAVDGDHDGVKSIMDPADAIYTAAHYLCANGAGRGPGALSSAILHYNHAEWYVAMVLKLSAMYATAYP